MSIEEFTFETGCNCVADAPCPLNSATQVLRTFENVASWNKHNNKKHDDVLFNPKTMIKLPRRGWRVFSNPNGNPNQWIIQRMQPGDVITTDDPYVNIEVYPIADASFITDNSFVSDLNANGEEDAKVQAENEEPLDI